MMRTSKCLAILVVGLTLVACLGAVASSAPASGKLEIFSWWAGDEGPALEALIELYEKQHPGVEVIKVTL